MQIYFYFYSDCTNDTSMMSSVHVITGAVSLLPAKRRRTDTDWSKCVFCQDGRTQERLIACGEAGLHGLCQALQSNRDHVYYRLLPDFENLGEKHPVYHLSCYAKNVSHKSETSMCTPPDTPERCSPPCSTRKATYHAARCNPDLCIICQVVHCPHVKSVNKTEGRKLCQILTMSSANAILEAASRRQDVVFLRTNGLSLLGMQYHSKCKTAYMYAKGQQQTQEGSTSQDKEQRLKTAFCTLLHETEQPLLDGMAFDLSTLRQRMNKLLHVDADEPDGSSRSVDNRKLKSMLEAEYGPRMVFKKQDKRNASQMVYLRSVSKTDVIMRVRQLNESLEDASVEQELLKDEDRMASDETTMSVLYNAVAILRNELANLDIPAVYPNSNEVTLQASKKFVPPLLGRFMLWLVDGAAYEAASDMTYTPTEDKDRRATALAECAIYGARQISTPLHLGLAAQLHHDYGKRGLIDTLNAHGFTVHYDELRRFQTAKAQGVLNQMESGVYKPQGLIPRPQGGCLIQEGDDNIDINTETIDGKNTLHSMARVVFQRQPTDAPVPDAPHVARGRAKSLPLSPDQTTALTGCIHFEKPKSKPEPPRRKNAVEKITSCIMNPILLGVRDMSWVLLRLASQNILPLPAASSSGTKQDVPFWTGFNAMLSPKQDCRTVASYAPIINAVPSDMQTVYTTMRKAKETCLQLGQENVIQTMDLQLYSVAEKIKWYKPGEMVDHVLRLGGFHALSSYIAAIGKIYGDGGLKDLLINAGVFAPCTTVQLLAGKHFHRAIRGLTLVFEALMRLWMSSFIKWLEDEQKEVPREVWKQLMDAHAAVKSGDDKLARDAMNQLDDTVEHLLLPLFEDFQAQACHKSPTFHYWKKLLDCVNILLMNIRAEREGDWARHLHTQASMLPYFFSASRVNYARWMAVYILEMLELPPDVLAAFEAGEFAIQQTSGRFNAIWSDMATECSVIRDAKGQSGIIGITRKDPAVVRWTSTRHLMAEYSNTMRARSGQSSSSDRVHEQSHPSAMERDEKHVQAIVTEIRDNMTNPFATDEHPDKTLVNISTGLHASSDVQASLLGVLDAGQREMEKFVTRSLSEEGTASFYSPIPRAGLLTFTDMLKKTKISCGSKTLEANISPEVVFRRALTMAKSREDIGLHTVLSHPVTSVPTSLFHEDGSMRKTSKAELCQVLEAEGSSVSSIPPHDAHATVYIIDSMGKVQSMSPEQNCTFDSLAQKYLASTVQCFHLADTVVEVFDRYDHPHSVKSAERERRQATGPGSRKYQVMGGRPVPPWRNFLTMSDNKSSLAKFLSNYMLDNAHRNVQSADHTCHKRLYLAGGFQDGRITKCLHLGRASTSEDDEDLYSSQEEADSRMFLHAMKADWEFTAAGVQGRLVIRTPDTDVVVLAVHYFQQMESTQELWIETGQASRTIDHRRFIPVHEICKAMDPALPAILPAVHALTGCDSVSSLFGIGKKSMMKTLMQHGPAEFEDLTTFSARNVESAVLAGRKFIAVLYDPKKVHVDSHQDLNALRVKFSTSREKSLLKLPPSEPAFIQHVKRAAWQARVWMNSHLAQPDVGSPLDNGWQLQDEKVVPIYFEGPTSAELLKGLLCQCSGRHPCRNGECSCSKAGLGCTELCGCGAEERCSNAHSDDADED